MFTKQSLEMMTNWSYFFPQSDLFTTIEQMKNPDDHQDVKTLSCLSLLKVHFETTVLLKRISIHNNEEQVF